MRYIEPFWVAEKVSQVLGCVEIKIYKSPKSSSMYITVEYMESTCSTGIVRIRVSDHPHPNVYNGDLDLCSGKRSDTKKLKDFLKKFITVPSLRRGGGDSPYE